jgi:hypothetical protein
MSVTKVQLVSDGAVIGIQSAGTAIGSGVTTLNFIGAGNTFAYNTGTKTLDISISSGGTNIFTILSRSGAGVTVSAPASTLTVYGRNSNTSISI